jgi:hypothetical protein
MKLSHSLPVLFLCLSALAVRAQEPNSRQQLQEQPDEWDEASWSPPDQDSTGLPGDNFSLQGALALFKEANSPEEFEKLLNTESNKVNNLDLNEDGNIDYLRVINKKQNQVQLFIIQALVSNQESQDIAVIELEKTGDNNAVIQIAGDEDIYGETTLAEPAETPDNAGPADADRNSWFSGPSSPTHGPAADLEAPAFTPAGVIVNVWFWPCVRRVYAPAYVVWTSPWSWVSPPVWWRPWRPMPVYAYRPVCQHYRYGYAYAPVRRIPPARTMYYPTRTYSGMVYSRNRVVVGDYRSSRADRGHYPGRYDGGRYNGGRYDNGGYRNNYNGRNNGRPSNTRPGYPRDTNGRNNWSDNRNNNYSRPGTRESYSGGNNNPRGSYQTPPRSNNNGSSGGRTNNGNNGSRNGSGSSGRAGRTRNI